MYGVLLGRGGRSLMGLVLAELLSENGIGYEHLPETGGRKMKPKPDELATRRRPDHRDRFRTSTVIMCSESKPLSDHKVPRANCHRVGMLRRF